MAKVCFSASSGGHFEQLMMLKSFMDKHDSFIITEKTSYINGKSNYPIFYVKQINRRERLFIVSFISVIIKEFFIFMKEKPDYVIATGALATVPICLIAKIFGKKVIFIESFAKINSKTLTGKFIYKFADLFIVQWESLLNLYPEATYGGGIY